MAGSLVGNPGNAIPDSDVGHTISKAAHLNIHILALMMISIIQKKNLSKVPGRRKLWSCPQDHGNAGAKFMHIQLIQSWAKLTKWKPMRGPMRPICKRAWTKWAHDDYLEMPDLLIRKTADLKWQENKSFGELLVFNTRWEWEITNVWTNVWLNYRIKRGLSIATLDHWRVQYHLLGCVAGFLLSDATISMCSGHLILFT